MRVNEFEIDRPMLEQIDHRRLAIRRFARLVAIVVLPLLDPV
jgi:hypothetical protein